MKILRNISDLKKAINKIPLLGFVPTMGGLHFGHASLIHKSQKKCKKTLVSIYVNPAQFNNKKDFKNYPRQINKDLKILKNLKVDLVFLPNDNEIQKYRVNKNIKLLKNEKIMCAKYRKGHFEGVIYIMRKFVDIINPNCIFLGEKDYQQLFLIKKYIEKKDNYKIIPCKTIRDKNFIAISTRNSLLNKEDLSKASYIAKKIYNFKKMIISKKKGINDIFLLKKLLNKKLNIKIDYLEIRNEKDLKLFKNKTKFKIFIAYYLNKIRLIDNF
jgi:pantoate--beta-alanine ligase